MKEIHSLKKDWWRNLPHPKFRQSNCIVCPTCKMVLSYSYFGKKYGLGYESAVYNEIPRCREVNKLFRQGI